MPELPDIYVLVRSMELALKGRRIASVSVNQPKVLNCIPREFVTRVKGQVLENMCQRGKWALIDLEQKWTLALNLGMGGEVRLHEADEEPNPKRERVVFRLEDGWQIWIHFWWFGSVHLVPKGRLEKHPQIAKLGVEPLGENFTVESLVQQLQGRRGRLKKYLLDQSFIAGIGNVYVQDILWYAGLHPERGADTLTHDEIVRLHDAIRRTLSDGIKYGGGPGEQDIWGKSGTYMEHRPVGYRTGQPCPKCATTIEELRVGSTTSYVCPHCQI